MTLDEARMAIGRKVIYRAEYQASREPGEEGVITSVNSQYVLVRYGAKAGAQATLARNLEPIA